MITTKQAIHIMLALAEGRVWVLSATPELLALDFVEGTRKSPIAHRAMIWLDPEREVRVFCTCEHHQTCRHVALARALWRGKTHVTKPEPAGLSPAATIR
ncbi:MAG: hypothetical protein Q7W44_04180 [Coriobacteriia bacterium]|nr:hypothetical protein [Coriobacteriia bacterium]